MTGPDWSALTDDEITIIRGIVDRALDAVDARVEKALAEANREGEF